MFTILKQWEEYEGRKKKKHMKNKEKGRKKHLVC